MYIETVEHVFYSCNIVRNIWLGIEGKLYITENVDIKLTVSDVLFCYNMLGKDTFSAQNVNVNNVILYTKNFIWQCKTANVKPTMQSLMNNLERNKIYIPYFSNIV